MKVCHWTLGNGSGLHNVACEISKAEVALGLDSFTVNTVGDKAETEWEKGVDADVHVLHSHIPDKVRKASKGKVVFIPHGTPEHVFQVSVENFTHRGYAAGNAMTLCLYWLKEADAVATFWPRHKWIFDTMTGKRGGVHLIPMGVDKEAWKPMESRGKFAGTPSVLTLENSHTIKWPLDLFLAWPEVCRDFPEARLHAHYLPADMHRFWYPLISANGADYTMFSSSMLLKGDDLRNFFVSADYYCGLVRYGDFNKVCLEAKACGAKVISYAGNPYSDYWILEGDQRMIAESLKAIFSGNVEPRIPEPVPDIKQTAEAMKQIYEGIC